VASVNPVNADVFRRLAGSFATGVTIVTTDDSNAAPCGMTANSFASVSLEPPLISIAVDHAATIYPAMLRARRFTVNVLAASQEALSRRFAEGLDERFDGIAWHRDAEGHVLIDGSLAHICCERWAEIPAGDHTIFVGLVTSGDVDDSVQPLMHYQGRYL